MDIDKIRTLVDTGFLKSNRYKLKLALPANSALSQKYSAVIELINDNCNSINLPGTDILTFDWASKGAPIKLPYQRAYNPLVLSFYVDKNNYVRQFFEDWISIVWDAQTEDFNYLSEYSTSLTIEVLNDKNEIAAVYAIDQAWPTKIDDVPASYADGEVQKCTATLTYNIYKLTMI